MTDTPGTHTIVKGDTLYSLARAYRVSVADLETWNPGIVPTALIPGQVIRVAAPDPLQAQLDAANAEITELTATVAGMQASLDAAAAQHTADLAAIATLQAQLDQRPPAPAPPVTLFGVNASSAAEHDARAAFAPVQVWRHYRTPGQRPLPPNGYKRGPGQVFVLSNKITPQQMATGEYDDDYATLARWMQPGDQLIPWHEPEDDIEHGRFTLAQYHDLCDRVVSVAKAANAAAQVGPCIMGTFTVGGGNGRKWRDYLFDGADFLGFDEYFSGTAGGKPFGGSLAQIPGKLDVLAEAAAAAGLPWGLDETSVGTREGKPGSTARNDGVRALAAGARQRGATRLCWFDVGQWAADPTAVAAWKAGQSG